MHAISVIPAELIAAYRETLFRVESPALAFNLIIEQVSDELNALHQQYNVTCSTFITACNPYSKELGDIANAERQLSLANELNNRSLQYLHGIGNHPSGDWPGEPSYLVLGISLEAAKMLGKQYEQNAIVWCGSDAVPQLILLR